MRKVEFASDNEGRKTSENRRLLTRRKFAKQRERVFMLAPEKQEPLELNAAAKCKHTVKTDP